MRPPFPASTKKGSKMVDSAGFWVIKASKAMDYRSKAGVFSTFMY